MNKHNFFKFLKKALSNFAVIVYNEKRDTMQT